MRALVRLADQFIRRPIERPARVKLIADAAPRAKKYRYYGTQGSQGYNSGSVERGNGYYERLADKLPFGSSIWWEQMMRERRGGRPG